jgi:uncharacterized membrane protein YfcA
MPSGSGGSPDTVGAVWAPVAQAAFLAGAGIVAGAVGSSGAIGSLISYPALLIVGIAPLPANVTHAVAVSGGGIGSTIQSRPELRGSWARLAEWSIITTAGAIGGTALLLGAPGTYFVWAMPFLVAGGGRGHRAARPTSDYGLADGPARRWRPHRGSAPAPDRPAVPALRGRDL